MTIRTPVFSGRPEGQHPGVRTNKGRGPHGRSRGKVLITRLNQDALNAWQDKDSIFDRQLRRGKRSWRRSLSARIVTLMADLRPLIQARQRLSYAAPLDVDDELYIDRPDHLGAKISGRLLGGQVKPLLLAGAAGCGKTTELRRIAANARADYVVAFCPFDRDVGVELDKGLFFSYLLWCLYRAARDCSATQTWTGPTAEITREVLHVFNEEETSSSLLTADAWPSWSTRGWTQAGQETLIRLIAEIQHLRPVLFIVDGLEKLPARISSAFMADLLQSRVFRMCPSLIVVPTRLKYGRDAITRSPEVDGAIEFLSVPVREDPSFITTVIIHRFIDAKLKAWEAAAAVTPLISMSGGIIRDAIQLVANTVQHAIDDRSETVSQQHAQQAIAEMSHALKLTLSDEPDRARKFLSHVQSTGTLPGDPEMRDLTLALNLIIEDPSGTFRVHPLIKDF